MIYEKNKYGNARFPYGFLLDYCFNVLYTSSCDKADICQCSDTFQKTTNLFSLKS